MGINDTVRPSNRRVGQPSDGKEITTDRGRFGPNLGLIPARIWQIIINFSALNDIVVMDSNRRTVLKGIGAGTALLVAPVGASSASEEEAGLRVAHASPDAPNVDVYVDGDAVIENLAFGAVTDYLEVPAGAYDIAVKVAGTETTVFSAEGVELAAEDYTAVALGEVGSDDTEFTVSLFEDTNGANLGEEEARVRAIHASPDAPNVDVTVDDDALTLFEDVAFGDSSGYAVVPAGEYEVEIRPAGADAVVFEAAVELEAGSTYTAFAVGYLSPDDEPIDDTEGKGFTLLPIEDKSAPPRGAGGPPEDRGNGGGPPEGRGNGRGR